MPKLLIATRNPGKFKELMEVLKEIPFEFVSLENEKIEGDVEESGETYEENAILKAEYFGQNSGLPTLADDSGIVVEALAGELGVKTRRWGAGQSASDQEWLDFFLKRMEKEVNRKADFLTVIAFYQPGKETVLFSGECKGGILPKPQVELEPGIPLSAVFLPEGKDKVFSAMSKDEKNAISHRGKAIKQAAEYLKRLV